MKRCIGLLLLFCATAYSCASRPHGIRDADAVAFFGGPGDSSAKRQVEPDTLLSSFTVKFKIPNPLIEQGAAGIRRIDPSHENWIYCRAVLLDSLATEVDIASVCRKDSLDANASEVYRRKYMEEQVKPGQFRIRISMESGFSPKSLDPNHWVMYLINAKGVAVEPVNITSTPVVSTNDSIFSASNRISLPRTLMRSDITLYFNRVTFFKEDLLGSANPFIALELVNEQKTVARVVWKRSKERE